MPLWAWHRPILLLIAWILVATINSAQNNTTQAFTTSKSSDQGHFQDLASHSVKEKVTEETPTSTVEDNLSVSRKTTSVTSNETTTEADVSLKEVVTDETKDGLGSTEKGALENSADETPFGTKIRTPGPEADDEYPAKKETTYSDPTLPSTLENYNISEAFGKKIVRNATGQLENDPEFGLKQNAFGQRGTMQEGNPNSTLTANTTSHDTSKVSSSSENKFSSPETFTRAQLMRPVSDYNEDITPDSELFTKTTFPYGSRFHPKTSVFYSNVNVADGTRSKWSPDLWSSAHTTQWTDPYASCSSSGCEDVYKSTVTSSLSPLYESDPVSPMFFRTDRELWVNNYKGNTYIVPSHTATRVTRTKTGSLFSVSRKGESELDDGTMLGYIPRDEDFGMRITSTNMFASVLSHTGSFVSSPGQNHLSSDKVEATADNTIPEEFQKKTKDLDNRHTFELGSSYSNSMGVNVHTNDGRSDGTLLKVNKWTAVKAGESSAGGEMGIRAGNSSQGTSVVTFDLVAPTDIKETFENPPNSLSTLHSEEMMDYLNSSFGNTRSRFFFSTPTMSHGSIYNSFGVLQVFNTTWELTPTSIDSSTEENKNEVKYAHDNISFADTNYQKNAIDYNKQDKILKSGEQSSSPLHSTGYVSHSSQSIDLFRLSVGSVHDAFLSDSINDDRLYPGALYTSVPYLVSSSDYEGLFGDRIFSKQSTSHVVSPLLISTADAAFSPYLFSSFFEMSSSYQRFRPHSSLDETPFAFTSTVNSDYLLSSYWESEKSVLKEAEPKSSAPTDMYFVSRIVHGEDGESTVIEPTPVVFSSPTVDPFSLHESSILYFVSSSYPQLVSRLVGRNSTSITASSSASKSPSESTISTFGPPWDPRELTPPPDDHDEVPPPRITNPSCNTLPTCITMTIGMTWMEFCPLSEHLKKQLAESLSQIIKPIHPHQLVLSSDQHQCKVPGQENEVFNNARRRRRRRRRRRSESFVEIRIFIVDHDGEYDEKLTEICGVILKKWMPTAGAPFQNKILEVRISHVGEEETEETSDPKTIPAESPTSTGIIAAITISTIAGACLFLLCILLVVMKQRLLQNRNCNPALDAYSLDSFSINASFRRRRVRQSMRSFLNHAFEDPELPSHPLNESGLVNCLKNTELLHEEFKKLPMNMPKLEQIPPGAEVKNRYANVVPNPDTRVLLSISSEDPLKEYINANYVKGYDGKHRAYIATQAPLPETVNDFWQMVWEQQCKVIIMLTLLEENGVPRCAPYFPESTLDCHKLYGDFQVSLQKKDIREFYTMSTFRLYHLEKNLFREVSHFWYTAWPAAGVPGDPGYLVTFLLQARPFINTNTGPTVVHCSPGTGRTGAILALDMSMREFEQSRSVDILRCVARIRKDRGGAVQNKEQYILLHEALVEYASYIANQSHRPSIRSND